MTRAPLAFLLLGCCGDFDRTALEQLEREGMRDVHIGYAHERDIFDCEPNVARQYSALDPSGELVHGTLCCSSKACRHQRQPMHPETWRR